MKKLATLALALALAACGANRPALERQSFLVRPERPGAPVARAADLGLRIGPGQIAPPFDSQAFVYRRDDVLYQSDFYNQFATDPAIMLAEAAGGWLRQSGLFRRVLPSASGGVAELRLEFEVEAMYIDFRSEPPAAVLDLRWQVRREGEDSSLAELAGSYRALLAERSPAGAARAYGKALAEAFVRLEEALAGMLF